MDFRQLQYVLAIAREGTILQAAKALYISQPSLTKFLQGLEKEIGVPLFYRAGKRYRLTYAGERYVSTARRIMDLKTQLDRELLGIIRKDVGVLRVGFPLVRGSYILPYVLPRFHKSYPNIRVQVQEVDSKLLEPLLLQGDIDLAFFSHAGSDPAIEYTPIALEEYVLIISPRHPLAGEGIRREGCRYPWLDLRRFAGEDFVMLEGSQNSREIMEGVFHSYSISPNIALTLRNLSTLMQMVKAGYGFSFVLETHVLQTPLEQRPLCFSMGESSITMTSVAASRRGVYYPHYKKDFVDMVQEFYVQALGKERDGESPPVLSGK